MSHPYLEHWLDEVPFSPSFYVRIWRWIGLCYVANHLIVTNECFATVRLRLQLSRNRPYFGEAALFHTDSLLGKHVASKLEVLEDMTADDGR